LQIAELPPPQRWCPQPPGPPLAAQLNVAHHIANVAPAVHVPQVGNPWHREQLYR